MPHFLCISWLLLGALLVQGTTISSQQPPCDEDGVCPANAPADGLSRKQPNLKAFQPFVCPDVTWQTEIEPLFRRYKTWHVASMSASIQPTTRKFLVFTPVAGLGDSFAALLFAIAAAMRSGRLLFLHWSTAFSIGVTPAFPVDWQEAIRMIQVPNPADDGNVVVTMRGHPTSLDLFGGRNNFNNNQLALLGRLMFTPSKEVETMMTEVLSKTSGTRLIGIQIRTGTDNINEGTPFLSPEDIIKFAKCAARYTKENQVQIPTSFFIATDSSKAARTTAKYLAKTGAVHQVTQANIVHILKASTDSEQARRDMVKVWADFFLLSKCDVVILTHHSLFGSNAIKMSPNHDHLTQLQIGDSHCDVPGHYPCYGRVNSPICGP